MFKVVQKLFFLITTVALVAGCSSATYSTADLHGLTLYQQLFVAGCSGDIASDLASLRVSLPQSETNNFCRCIATSRQFNSSATYTTLRQYGAAHQAAEEHPNSPTAIRNLIVARKNTFNYIARKLEPVANQCALQIH
jgi:hypothetical protein